MNREDAIRLVDAYVDNELDVKDALEIQALLEVDASVREEYERVLALKSVLRREIGEEGPSAPDLLKKRVIRTMRRESAGSITPSISKCDAMLSAFPCSYMRATICS